MPRRRFSHALGPRPSFLIAPSIWRAAPANPHWKSAGNLRLSFDDKVGAMGKGGGLISSLLGIGVGETVVVNGGDETGMGAHKDDKAALPYSIPSSVGVEPGESQVVVKRGSIRPES